MCYSTLFIWLWLYVLTTAEESKAKFWPIKNDFTPLPHPVASVAVFSEGMVLLLLIYYNLCVGFVL